jgi:hypothetical protein
MSDVVLFVFAGRRPNMELQLRWAHRVLELNPDTRYEIWNLARNQEDSHWLHDQSGERMVVRNEYSHLRTGEGMNQVWGHYARHPMYRHTTLVKVDDDVVFFDPTRFTCFASVVKTNPELIISADVINNGACDRDRLGRDPLTAYAHLDHAAAAHQWWFQNCYRLDTTIELVPQPDWISINVIGLNQRTARKLHAMIGTRAPAVIAGHRTGRGRFGDEGAANMLHRSILRGVMAAHLSFGPQQVPETVLKQWRDDYSIILDRCTQ